MIIEEIKEFLDFFNKAYKLISERKFEEAEYEIKKYTDEIKNKSINKNSINHLLMHLGWIRDDLDATQKEKIEFDSKAKEIVTAINKLILIIIFKIENSSDFQDNEKMSFFEELNRLFEPIFMEISEKKEGFAYFGRIELDRDYYKNIYSKMIDNLKIEDGIELKKFSEWKKQYDENFAKKMGVTNGGK